MTESPIVAFGGAMLSLSSALPYSEVDRLISVARAFWSLPQVTGVWDEEDEIGIDSKRRSPSDLVRPRGFGLLAVPAIASLGCRQAVASPANRDEAWFEASIPSVEIFQAVSVEPRNVGMSDSEPAHAWERPIHTVLCLMAKELHAMVPFDLALIGFDSMYEDTAAEFRSRGRPAAPRLSAVSFQGTHAAVHWADFDDRTF